MKKLVYVTPDQDHKGKWKMVDEGKCTVNNMERSSAIKAAAKLNRKCNIVEF